MVDWTGRVLVLVVLFVSCGALAGFLLRDRWRAWRQLRERSRFEDALKHMLDCEQGGGYATVDSLGGVLGLSLPGRQRLIGQMEAAGLVRSVAEVLRLTTEGKRVGLQVMRAHRLWERYLADEAAMPLDAIHHAAHRAEHRLTPEELDVLDAHMGYPQADPHGDPIPRASGEVEPVRGMPLSEWAGDEPVRILHIEDEPEVVFSQIIAEGLRPGQVVRVVSRDSTRVVVMDVQGEYRLAPLAAARIEVGPVVPVGDRLDTTGLTRLADVPDGQEVEVVGIDDRYRGFGRRRLLDLGLTSGAIVQPELRGLFRDPRAFRVRGSLVSLRREQADKVWVRDYAGDDGTEHE
ncbi:MAG: DtxR family transcriptional regulator [Phycisphaerae bacterium]|nr:DtxR family transcriptional regulator [Phycisphaerae bacterium]